MMPYQTKLNILSGSNIKELRKKMNQLFKRIRPKTKRKPYVRSAYFNKDKIFFDFFWQHLEQKNRKIKTERIKYFSASIDLIRNCHNHPTSKDNPNNKGEVLHRFYGLTKEKYLFCVQIKEIKKNGKKYLISIFPSTKKEKDLPR